MVRNITSIKLDVTYDGKTESYTFAPENYMVMINSDSNMELVLSIVSRKDCNSIRTIYDSLKSRSILTNVSLRITNARECINTVMYTKSMQVGEYIINLMTERIDDNDALTFYTDFIKAEEDNQDGEA